MLALFGLILLMGGAGDSAFRLSAITQSAALLLVALALPGPRERACALPSLLLAGAILLLPVVHLVPIPPGTWAALPGREDAARAMSLAGVPARWRPLSLDAQLTIESALELAPLLAALLLGWQAGPRLRVQALAAVVAVALLSALMGGAQRLGLGESVMPSAPARDAPGLFINRNHQALLLLIALPLAACLLRLWTAKPDRSRGVAAMAMCGIGIILLAGTLATGSRAGLLLLPLSLAATMLVFGKGASSGKAFLALLLVIGVVGIAATRNDVLGRPFERMIGEQDDVRPMIRAHSAELVARNWPAGTGLGTFVRAWSAVEPPEAITGSYVNHAHNDYLELLAEGGVLVPVAAGLGLVGIMLARRRRREQGARGAAAHGDRAVRLAAATGLALIALHSLVDFPLRMMSLMAVAGLLAGLLLAPDAGAGADPAQPAERASLPARRPATALLLAALPLGLLWPVWAVGLSREAIARGETGPALVAWPWSSEGWTDQGYAALAAGKADLAATQARRAIDLAPLNARAYALMVATLERKGDAVAAAALLDAARRLGRREPRLEYRAMERAFDAGDYAAAARQVDVLLRQDAYTAPTIDFARSLATDPAGATDLAAALSRNPAWRGPYMTDLSGLRAEDAAGHADLLRRLRGSAAPPRPAEVNALLARQLALGLTDQAATFALKTGRAVRGQLLPEPAAQAGADGQSFGWEVRGGTGGDAWAEPDAPAPAERFVLRARGTMVGPVLVRRVMAAQGQARLVWRGRQDRAGAAQALSWSLRCEAGGAALKPEPIPLSVGRDQRVSGTVLFTVPAGCPLQILTASMAWQDGGSLGFVIERVELR